MSDWKLFTKSNTLELRAELDQAFRKSKPHARVKVVLKKVLANIILNNNELANLLPDVILLMKIDDLDIRKLCLQCVANYATVNPKAAAGALPFLARFKDDHNALLRGITIRTLTLIPLPEFADLAYPAVRKALDDKDVYVRKAAIFAVARLHQNDPDRTAKLLLIADLNDLLESPSHTIVSYVLAALHSITEQGRLLLSLDRTHCRALVGHLPKANKWTQSYILTALTDYAPQTSEEALELIEVIIPSLLHENSAVVLNAIKLIVYLSNYVHNPELVLPALPKRLGSSLASLLSKPAEIQFLVLRNVILLLLGKRYLVHFEVESFFCRYDDPIYIKDTKLEIIYLLANETNVAVVLRELEEYATEVDVAMARKAIRAFGNLAVKISNAATECVNVLCDLTANGISYIVQESAIVIKNILRKYPGHFHFAIEELVKHYKVIDEPDAKAALIWIIGQYSAIIIDTPTILGELVLGFLDDPAEVQYAALTAVIKYYLQDPKQGEPLVIKVLQWATESVDNPDIRDRGFFYWRLISADQGPEFQKHTKEVVLNNNPVISADNDAIDPHVLEELELNIGTLASIYLKPLQLVFRLAKQKTLPHTPALQPRRNLAPSLLSQEDPLDVRIERDLRPPPPPPKSNSTGSSDASHFDAHDFEAPDVKGSLARRLSRKASMIAGRKNNKF